MRPHRRQPTRLLHPWDSPGKNTRVGCHFLLHFPYYRGWKAKNYIFQTHLEIGIWLRLHQLDALVWKLNLELSQAGRKEGLHFDGINQVHMVSGKQLRLQLSDSWIRAKAVWLRSWQVAHQLLDSPASRLLQRWFSAWYSGGHSWRPSLEPLLTMSILFLASHTFLFKWLNLFLFASESCLI